MIGIAGIRGVGKTTLLWQLAGYVNERFKNPQIIFLSLDQAVYYGFSSTQLTEALQENIPFTQECFLLLDEVQYLQKWPLMLKIIYDTFNKCFIIATGSSSLLLRSSADLATRWNIETLYPLNFPEYVLIRSWLKSSGKNQIYPSLGLSRQLKEALFHSNSAKESFLRLKDLSTAIKGYLARADESIEEYIKLYNIPRFLQAEEEAVVLERAFDLIQRIVELDLKETYPGKDTDIIGRIITYLAVSDNTSPAKISSQFGVNEETIREIISSLVKAEFLIKFPQYGGIKTTLKREKLFFTSPTLRYALVKQLFTRVTSYLPKLYEDITAMYLKKLFNGLVLYGGTGENKSPDFIVEVNNALLPLEVGSSKKTIEQLTKIKERKYGILINFRSRVPKLYNQDIEIPGSWFLLL